MMHSFPELTIGGVLVAPFVMYAVTAIAIFRCCCVPSSM